MTVRTVTFANPYHVCTTCGGWVTGAGALGTPERPGPTFVIPCGHPESNSVCPSWSPVDGCTCQARLGAVGHPEPPGGPS